MGQDGIRADRKFYREQRGETFLYISGRAFIGARALTRSLARSLINAGIEQTGNRLEQKAPPRTFFHLSNFSHYREISLLLFLPFALDPQIELSPITFPPPLCRPSNILTAALGNFCVDNPPSPMRDTIVNETSSLFPFVRLSEKLEISIRRRVFYNLSCEREFEILFFACFSIAALCRNLHRCICETFRKARYAEILNVAAIHCSFYTRE